MGLLIFKKSGQGGLITKSTSQYITFTTCYMLNFMLQLTSHSSLHTGYPVCVVFHRLLITAPVPKTLSASQTAGSTEPPHMPPQMPHSPVKIHHSSSQIRQHMSSCAELMPSEGQLAQAPLEIPSSHAEVPWHSRRTTMIKWLIWSVCGHLMIQKLSLNLFLQNYTSTVLFFFLSCINF